MSFDVLSASYPDHSSMKYFVDVVFALCLISVYVTVQYATVLHYGLS